MTINKKRLLNISKYIEENSTFYFPFQIICTDFNENDEFFEIDCLELDNKYIEENQKMQNFILIENLQNLYQETVELMAKGFIEKIENTNNIKRIEKLAVEYRKEWKEELWESEDTEEYGLNEFIGGKAEAYEECLRLLKN